MLKNKKIDDGALYTFGNGKRGELGHNDGLTYHSPRPVDFFVKNNKKVIDVCCSGDQTVVLTGN